MGKGEGISWLDEAFDEQKAAEDLEHAKRSRRIGYALLAVFVALIAVFGFSCSGMLGVMAGLA